MQLRLSIPSTWRRAAGGILLGVGLAGPSWADLQPRLGGAAIYDADLNITWLANANLAATSGFGTAGINADGSMNWSAAQNWIASMNSAKYLGFSTWRLPATPLKDSNCSIQDVGHGVADGYNCIGGELGHLFYLSLGGQSSTFISAAHNSSFGLFTNFQDMNHCGGYLSGIYPPDASSVWLFQFCNGSLVAAAKTSSFFVVPVLTGDVAANSVLPQFAFGGGWYSALYFTNLGTAAVSFPVTFVSDAGLPLTVPSVGGSSTLVNLAARGSAIIEAPNTGPLTQGYVLLSLPAAVTGYGVFRQSVAGIADQEAVVPLAGAFSSSSTLLWDDTDFTTAVAIVNLSSTPAMVAITLRDSNGMAIGTSSLPLEANRKVARALRSLPGLSGVVGNRGSADFTVTSGNIAVLGLRFGGAAFTSIPTAQH